MLTALPLALQSVHKSLPVSVHVQRLHLTPACAWYRYEDSQCAIRLKVLRAHPSQLGNLHCISEVDVVQAKAHGFRVRNAPAVPRYQ